ncbi:MAG: hypothetical protein IIU82_05275 [Tidjanibacter sp.]|nr:hypothetical protein [Tidjanibacter sp.]
MEFNLDFQDMNVEQVVTDHFDDNRTTDSDDMVVWCRELLDKYYEGATTPAEESLLRRFLTSAKNLPVDLEAEAALFGGVVSLREESTDIEVLPFKRQSRLSQILRTRWVSAISVAAVACMAILAGLNANMTYGYINGVPIKDGAFAMEQMQVAMTYVSDAFGQMQGPAESARESMEQLDKVMNMFR